MVEEPKQPNIDEELKSLEVAEIAPPKKKKYGWVGYVFLALMIAIGIWLIFKIVGDMGGDVISLGEAIAGGDLAFALISLIVLLTILFCDWMKYSVIIKTTTGKFNLRTALKVQLLGKFYDKVTPFAAGGQPMQIYYLHKKGFSGGVSSAVVLIKYFAQMFCYTVISLLIMLCNTRVLNLLDTTWHTLISVAAWIGLVANMLIPLMIVLFAIIPKFARALVSLIVTVGFKLRIVKDKEAAAGKAEKVVSDFRTAFAIMSKNPLNLFALIALCVVEICLSFSFPYFIMRSFSALPSDGGFAAFISVAALNVYATQSVTVIPSPGNAGAIDGVGTIAFLAIASTAALSWVIFCWRFAVYYIYLIIGVGILSFEFIRKIVRQRKAAKQR